MLPIINYNNFVDNKPIIFRLAHGLILLIILLIFTYTLNSPTQNWDMLGYAASATSLENTDKNYIHSTIYKQFKEYATDEEYQELTTGHSYRETMLVDPEAFSQQIPFYEIRIMFTLLILGLVKMGVNIFVASHIVTAVLTCTGFLLYFYVFKKYIHPFFWLIIPIFFIIFGVHDVAKIVTADSLAFFWMGLICFAFLKEKWWAVFPLLIISVLVRTDMILLVAFFTFYLFMFKDGLRVASVLTLLLSIGVYLFINNYTGNYGWSTVFYYALVSDMKATHPEVYSSYGISLKQYFYALLSNLSLFLHDIPTLLFEAVVFLQINIQLLSRKTGTSLTTLFYDSLAKPMFVLTLISILYVLSHYLLFPLFDSRFFVGQYMIVGLVLLVTITRLIEKRVEVEKANQKLILKD